jgi:hypothetical protein
MRRLASSNVGTVTCCPSSRALWYISTKDCACVSSISGFSINNNPLVWIVRSKTLEEGFDGTVNSNSKPPAAESFGSGFSYILTSTVSLPIHVITSLASLLWEASTKSEG